MFLFLGIYSFERCYTSWFKTREFTDWCWRCCKLFCCFFPNATI